MAKLDFAKAKAHIAEIIEIVKTVPEPLQQRCFELLLEAALGGDTVKDPEPPAGHTEEPNNKEKQLSDGGNGKKLLPNVVAFMRRGNVSEEQLAKVFMLDHDPLLPIYKIPSGSAAKGQLIKVLMVLLENGLLNNSLSAPLRGVARER
jgi:hypothetical protein